jgi:release factor glutamine methyltransferase
MGNTGKTWNEILKSATEYLSSRKIEDADIVSELLAARLLNCKRLEVNLYRNKEISPQHLEAMRRGVKRAGMGEPVQYIIGEVEFLGHVFKIDRRAMIPRPETEELVQQVLQTSDIWNNRKPVVVDIGTGCGNIVITLALNKPEALYLGIDVSTEALELARENAVRLGVVDKVGFSSSSLSELVEPESIDVVVTNPPYIPTEEYEKLPDKIKKYEPRIALDGGRDGINVVESILEEVSLALKTGGLLFMEIGATQGNAIKELLNAWGFTDIKIIQDVMKRDRIITAKMGVM